MKSIGLAAIQHHNSLLAFPPARLRARNYYTQNDCESTQVSWLVRLMPYLEETSASSQWDLYETFEGHAASLREYAPESFVCPTRRSLQEAVIPSSLVTREIEYSCGCNAKEQIKLTSGAVGDYGANHGDFTGGSYDTEIAYWRGGNGTGVIISSRPRCRSNSPVDWIDKVRMKDLIDGSSNTALAGEMHIPAGRLKQFPENGPMYNGKDLPAFARIGGQAIPLARGPEDKTVPVIGFGSWHPGVCPFVLADGSVRAVDNYVDAEVLQSLCRRDDEYEINYDEYFN